MFYVLFMKKVQLDTFNVNALKSNLLFFSGDGRVEQLWLSYDWKAAVIWGTIIGTLQIITLMYLSLWTVTLTKPKQT